MGNKLEECARAASKESTDEGKTRAVIRCLMEPSQAMIDAADDCDGSTAYDVPAHGVTHLRAMLQSVLDEGKL